MHIVVITAKGGNQSIEDKNLIEINGKSMLAHVIDIAGRAALPEKIYVSTECPKIAAEALKNGAEVIERPADLARPDSNHGDVIIHAALEAEKRLGEIATLTILLGNSIILRPEDIDRAITLLVGHQQADSAMTVWQAQDDHPYRAMQIAETGWLCSFGAAQTKNTNRQSYPPVYFYDQGPWSVRFSTLMRAAKGEKAGPACWWWMGERCLPIVRNWVTGKDVHSMLDVAIAKAWTDGRMWEL